MTSLKHLKGKLVAASKKVFFTALVSAALLAGQQAKAQNAATGDAKKDSIQNVNANSAKPWSKDPRYAARLSALEANFNARMEQIKSQAEQQDAINEQNYGNNKLNTDRNAVSRAREGVGGVVNNNSGTLNKVGNAVNILGSVKITKNENTTNRTNYETNKKNIKSNRDIQEAQARADFIAAKAALDTEFGNLTEYRSDSNNPNKLPTLQEAADIAFKKAQAAQYEKVNNFLMKSNKAIIRFSDFEKDPQKYLDMLPKEKEEKAPAKNQAPKKKDKTWDWD